MPMLRRLLPVLLLAACATPRVSTPPTAEFLLVAGDSTYWVTSGPRGVQVRGSPIVLARYEGRFHELYVADDDNSYYDALLVGQLVFTRDLITDDSVSVFSDTLVGRISHAYASAHPDDQPLGPNDPIVDRPDVVATSDVTLLGVQGPYLSIEYHADTHTRRQTAFHTTWRSVIDLRLGRPIGVQRLVGDSAGRALVAEARRAYDAVLDSVRSEASGLGAAVPIVLSEVRFDPRSFSLEDVDGRPAVAFAGRISGRRDGQGTLPLPPIAIDSAAWWSAVQPTLPIRADGDTVRWVRPGYTVLALTDTVDSVARVALVDSARHAWPVATVHLPLRRSYWLDHPPIDSTTRRALARAFNDAVLYDPNMRVATVRHARQPRRARAGALLSTLLRPVVGHAPRRHFRIR